MIMDTFGVANGADDEVPLPSKIREIIRPKMKLQTHCHNTFGLAVANTPGLRGGRRERSRRGDQRLRRRGRATPPWRSAW